MTHTQKMPNGTTRETYKEMQDSDKLNVLFDYVVALSKEQQREQGSRKEREEAKEQQCSSRWRECDNRFKVIEKRGNRLIGALIFLNIVAPVTACFIP